ncbi:cytochrome P450 [Hortaea werneckii]|nr:cytochrome P450 [Hortaea werneckii]
MSHIERPISGLLGSLDLYTAAVTFTAATAIYYLGTTIYDVYFGPLSKFPGPKINAWSRIPSILTLVRGDDNVDIPRLHQQYGPIVRIGPDSLSMADGAESFKQVYGFRKAGQPKPVKDTKFYGKPLNGVHSVIGADDAGHSRQRKILSNAFSDKALKEQTPLLKRWVGLMKNKLEERAIAGTETDMLKMYNCTTFDIMGDLTFGEGLNMLEDSEYSPWVKAIFGGIKNATFFRGIKLINALTSFVVEEIIFNRILEKSDGPDGLSLEEHHSNASLFMIAGTETTATALSGTTFYLLRNPESLGALTKEIRSAFQSFDDLDLEVLARQKYLMAVLQEGLRMYPPVPTNLPRVVPEGGMIIDGKFVPEGTTIGVHHLSTYRMESHFKNASEWHPERWLGDPEYKDDHLDALEPFSVGPRNCLGKNLAWHEMRLLLATVVLHFDLKLLPQSEKWNEQHVYTVSCIHLFKRTS